MKVLFLFIDGVGLRPPAPDNPVNPEVCPTLCRLISEHGIPIDACLSVDGLPQSATGQATMFTGVNASVYMGRHCEGFPGPSLRKIIQEDNIMMRLRAHHVVCRFADAYLIDSVDELALRRFKSVTTVMALTCPEVIAMQDDLLDNQAVMQDITRETVQDKHPDIPTVTPQRAAEHLFQIVRGNTFTLFEFFQSDLAGHSLDYVRACQTLRVLDAFLKTLVMFCKAANVLLVLTSDHGNIEDMTAHGHTRNPIPFVAMGPEAETLKREVKSLIDVTPALLKLLIPDETYTPRQVTPVA